MNLIVGDILTRKELADAVGAGGDSCLLHKNSVVVAIALNPDKNPDSPHVLLVGKGPHKERYARSFLDSAASVPTFIKKAADQWQYMGMFRGISLDHSPASIKAHAAKSGRRDIWGVLSLSLNN
ncbi:hypothetical protein [Desulfuromonas sp. TF]|uniref:hypothetical protein n=1 Tax=Desulfuromonas sp. TF TaxID=1232410 RepID=UPI00048958B6|nr:hypothetical protein [Desulfuromonas sp. TF]